MQPTQQPERQRVRRTERFAGASTESATEAQTQPFAQTYTQPAAQHPVSGLKDASPIERPEAARPMTPVKKPAPAMRRWLQMALIAALCVCAALYVANLLMDAYITGQEKAREAAYQRVVNSHPVLYRDLIEHYAAENNLQPAFVAAIILNESSYDRMAESSVGARGLMQLMEDTASWIAGKVNEPGYSFARMWDPESNIKFGCWYLGYLAKMFGGDPVCVASAYHAGQGTVSRWLLNSEYSPDGVTLNPETMPEGPTRTYAGRVIRAYAIYDQIYWNAFNPAADSPADGDGADIVPLAGGAGE